MLQRTASEELEHSVGQWNSSSLHVLLVCVRSEHLLILLPPKGRRGPGEGAQDVVSSEYACQSQ